MDNGEAPAGGVIDLDYCDGDGESVMERRTGSVADSVIRELCQSGSQPHHAGSAFIAKRRIISL